MKHFAIPTVNVYIIKDGKLLLNRRANTGWMDGYLCAPGGHVEEGETPMVAIVREIEEELGVSVLPEDIEFLCVAFRKNEPTEHIAFEFVIKDKSYAFINNEPAKCSELAWVDIHDLGDDMIADFKYIFEEGYLGRKPYLEVGYGS